MILLFCVSDLFSSSFLRTVPEVRSSGMGCVNNGISEGVSSLWLNPGGLVYTENYEFMFSHLIWPISGLTYTEDFSIQYEYLNFSKKIKNSAFGFNLSHYHQPDYKYYNNSYSIYSGFFSGTYARDFYYFQAGIRARYLWEVLGDYSGKAFSLDLGILRSFNFFKLYKHSRPNFTCGLSLYNIGSSIEMNSEKEPLPTNIQIGYSYILFNNQKNRFMIANDLKYYFGYDGMYKELEMNSGIEFGLLKMLSLRAGYIIYSPISSSGGSGFQNNKFTYGIGVRYKLFSFKLTLNYSRILNPVISDGIDTHSLSITFQPTGYEEKIIK